MSRAATDSESLSSSAFGHLWAWSRCSSSWSPAGFASEITEYHGARTGSLQSTGSAQSKSERVPLMEGQTAQSTDGSQCSSGGCLIGASIFIPSPSLCFKNLFLMTFSVGKSYRCLPMEVFASAVLQWTGMASVRPEVWWLCLRGMGFWSCSALSTSLFSLVLCTSLFLQAVAG